MNLMTIPSGRRLEPQLLTFSLISEQQGVGVSTLRNSGTRVGGRPDLMTPMVLLMSLDLSVNRWER
jgi:hypothetical protein